MLKTRVLTAAVLGPLFILGVWFLPPSYFAALPGAVILLATWEWTRLSGYSGGAAASAAVAMMAVAMLAIYGVRHALAEPLLLLACTAWLMVAAALIRRRHESLLAWGPAARWGCGVWVLLPAWLALIVLQEMNPAAALLLLVLVWAADTGAYFTGRRWGRRRLAPAISPGKSVEGVWGGTAAAMAAAAVFGVVSGLDAPRVLALVTWSGVVVVLSVFGDLFESNLKRLAGVKDSGGILPGHGGVLDRIDSITAAAPFFALGWLWWFDSAPA